MRSAAEIYKDAYLDKKKKYKKLRSKYKKLKKLYEKLVEKNVPEPKNIGTRTTECTKSKKKGE